MKNESSFLNLRLTFLSFLKGALHNLQTTPKRRNRENASLRAMKDKFRMKTHKYEIKCFSSSYSFFSFFLNFKWSEKYRVCMLNLCCVMYLCIFKIIDQENTSWATIWLGFRENF